MEGQTEQQMIQLLNAHGRPFRAWAEKQHSLSAIKITLMNDKYWRLYIHHSDNSPCPDHNVPCEMLGQSVTRAGTGTSPYVAPSTSSLGFSGRPPDTLM